MGFYPTAHRIYGMPFSGINSVRKFLLENGYSCESDQSFEDAEGGDYGEYIYFEYVSRETGCQTFEVPHNDESIFYFGFDLGVNGDADKAREKWFDLFKNNVGTPTALMYTTND